MILENNYGPMTIEVAGTPYMLCFKAGDKLSGDELNEIAFLIKKGNAVQGSLAKLKERVRRAHLIAVVRWDQNTIAGVAALKRTEDSYRNKISRKTNTDLSKDLFPAELGYVVVKPEFRGADSRGARLSFELMSALMTTVAGKGGIFATTKKDGLRDEALPKLGFNFRKTYQNDANEVVHLLTKTAEA